MLSAQAELNVHTAGLLTGDCTRAPIVRLTRSPSLALDWPGHDAPEGRSPYRLRSRWRDMYGVGYLKTLKRPGHDATYANRPDSLILKRGGRARVTVIARSNYEITKGEWNPTHHLCYLTDSSLKPME